MKKTIAFLVFFCFICLPRLMAQDMWKDIANLNGKIFLGVSADGSIFTSSAVDSNFTSYDDTIYRSSNEGDTWEIVLEASGQLLGHGDGFCINADGRVFVLDYNSSTIFYSDDNGDSWQQTTEAPLNYGLLCSPSNDVIVGWMRSQMLLAWTTDGGNTWNSTDFPWAPEHYGLGDVIVSPEGDVYISMWYYFDPEGACGIYHSTLSDMENWTLVAFQGAAIHQLEFDPDGNVVAAAFWGEMSGFHQQHGFYLFDGMSNEMAIADNGTIFHLNYIWDNRDDPWCSVYLDYSLDHGRYFSQIGDRVDTIPPSGGGRDGELYKGNDDHLYYCSNNFYTQSKIKKLTCKADDILEYFSLNTEWYSGMMVYPNPAVSVFTVSGENLKQIEVFDILGQKIATLQATGNKTPVDLIGQPAGVYLINVTDREGRHCVKKMVKQ